MLIDGKHCRNSNLAAKCTFLLKGFECSGSGLIISVEFLQRNLISQTKKGENKMEKKGT